MPTHLSMCLAACLACCCLPHAPCYTVRMSEPTVGEDKEDYLQMPDALHDLKTKLVGVNPMHYGSLPYILAYTAAGHVVQFHRVVGRPSHEHDSQVCMLGSMGGQGNGTACVVMQWLLHITCLPHTSRSCHCTCTPLLTHMRFTHAGIHPRVAPALQGHVDVDALTAEIDLSSLRGRADLALTLGQLYVLLVCMAQAVPEPDKRLPLFQDIQREGGTTLYMMSSSVLKSIADFDAFCFQHGTSLATLQLAYRAAEDEARQAVQELRPPTLVRAFEQPFCDRRGVYRVTTGPLGYHWSPSSEQARVLRGRLLIGKGYVLHFSASGSAWGVTGAWRI